MSSEHPLPLIDTHCHLDFPEFDSDRNDVLQRSRQAGIEYIINVGSTLENSRRAVALAKEYECVYASVGCHPHDADTYDEAARLAFKELSRQDKVKAIGEVGLDYFRNLSSRENQEAVFKIFLGLAKDSGLPVIIHCRQAQQETVAIVREFLPLQAVVHCFSGDEEFLKQCLSFGFSVSFTCNVTYKKAENLRQLVKQVPLERLLLETDAPYLAPEGHRGTRNEPQFVKNLAEEVARYRGISFEQVAQATTHNAKLFFSLP